MDYPMMRESSMNSPAKGGAASGGFFAKPCCWEWQIDSCSPMQQISDCFFSQETLCSNGRTPIRQSVTSVSGWLSRFPNEWDDPGSGFSHEAVLSADEFSFALRQSWGPGTWEGVHQKSAVCIDQKRLGMRQISLKILSLYLGSKKWDGTWQLHLSSSVIFTRTRWIRGGHPLLGIQQDDVHGCHRLVPEPDEIWRIQNNGWQAMPSLVVFRLFPLYDNDYDMIDVLLFYASSQESKGVPPDFSVWKQLRPWDTTQVATAALRSNSFTPSPEAKTGASGVPPNR